MYYLSEFCLLCLNSKQLESVFKLEDDEFWVQEQLKYCLPEIMISKSEIPNFICTSCRTTVNLFYKFRKTCLENYSRLTQYTEMLQASSDQRCHKFSELQIQINKLDLTMERDEDLDSKLNIKNEITNSLDEHDQRTVADDGVDTKEELQMNNQELLMKQEQSVDSELNVKDEVEDSLKKMEKHDEKPITFDTGHIKEEVFPDSEDQKFYLKRLKYEPAPDNEQDRVSRSSCEDDNQPDVDVANFSADTDSVNATCTNTDVERTYFKCFVCGKKFARNKYLTQHMKTHAEDRLHKCSVCDKFLVKDSITRHMKIHTGNQAHKCSICDKMFVQKCNLNAHMKIHEDNRNFKCSVCNKKFVNESSLVPHMKKHEGRLELDYECPLCNRKFEKGYNLERHIRLHMNNVGFECTICNKKLSQERYFVAHMNKHAGIRMYKCNVCDKAYFGENALCNHMRKHKEN